MVSVSGNSTLTVPLYRQLASPIVPAIAKFSIVRIRPVASLGAVPSTDSAFMVHGVLSLNRASLMVPPLQLAILAEVISPAVAPEIDIGPALMLPPNVEVHSTDTPAVKVRLPDDVSVIAPDGSMFMKAAVAT